MLFVRSAFEIRVGVRPSSEMVNRRNGNIYLNDNGTSTPKRIYFVIVVNFTAVYMAPPYTALSRHVIVIITFILVFYASSVWAMGTHFLFH